MNSVEIKAVAQVKKEKPSPAMPIFSGPQRIKLKAEIPESVKHAISAGVYDLDKLRDIKNGVKTISEEI